jgi:hypothetical protein
VIAGTPSPSSVVASIRRATSRNAPTSRPLSISSRIAAGFEDGELEGLGALLLASGELDVDASLEMVRNTEASGFD